MTTPQGLAAGVEAAFHIELAQERRRARAAVDAFMRALAEADAETLGSSLEALEVTGAWPTALRRAARLTTIPAASQALFLKLWVAGGDSIRCAGGGDLELLAALRILLPRYSGPSLTLYRGEGTANRQRRTYGLSWSASEAVADSFAQSTWRRSIGGSVLLRTVAPAEAIVCAPLHHGHDRYAEKEYLLDRRLLSRVEVIRRYSERSVV